MPCSSTTPHVYCETPAQSTARTRPRSQPDSRKQEGITSSVDPIIVFQSTNTRAAEPEPFVAGGGASLA